MSSNDNLIKRIENLETQLTFQEDIIDSLNQLVTQQNAELATVHEKIRWLGRKVSQLQHDSSGESSNPGQEPPPPHY
ncbi:MAG: SlyX family protein [Pseudomonadota bacterium]